MISRIYKFNRTLPTLNDPSDSTYFGLPYNLSLATIECKITYVEKGKMMGKILFLNTQRNHKEYQNSHAHN